MGQFFPIVAVDRSSIHILPHTQIVRKDPGAGTLLAIYITHAILCNIREFPDLEGIALCHHQSLLTTDTGNQLHTAFGEILANKCLVIAAVSRIQQVAASHVRLTAADCHDTAHGTHMGGADVQGRVLQMEHICQLVQQRIMAADNHQRIVQLF